MGGKNLLIFFDDGDVVNVVVCIVKGVFGFIG